MTQNSDIEWTDHTFNSWLGCTKVSAGCDHCYAEQLMDTRLHRAKWGTGQPRVRTSAANWREPVKWDAQHAAFRAAHGRRQRVFCASLADVFDNEAPAAWRADLFELVGSTPNLDWLILTKRIGNARSMWPADPLPNVWLGATLVNRDEMLRDAPKLKATSARVTFWSVEPMLGELGDIPAELFPDWVICGGESGPGARPMQPAWVRSLRDQCETAGVKFLFKQWGAWRPTQAGMQHVGKKAAGRELDGRIHHDFPMVTA
ncbi:phage Gp37/Gp68 family protein [Burkholderia sp. RS02]|uniref:phage Gp37/Gp68 family protein n=1 Tax=unclassified Burkholderia TaxID=2613784 RepID=UPI0032186389